MVASRRQYTIRGVPAEVDRALRKRAREGRKSVNQVVLEILRLGLRQKPIHRDLDFMIGTITDREVRRMDREIARQRKIDPELWK